MSRAGEFKMMVRYFLYFCSYCRCASAPLFFFIFHPKNIIGSYDKSSIAQPLDGRWILYPKMNVYTDAYVCPTCVFIICIRYGWWWCECVCMRGRRVHNEYTVYHGTPSTGLILVYKWNSFSYVTFHMRTGTFYRKTILNYAGWLWNIVQWEICLLLPLHSQGFTTVYDVLCITQRGCGISFEYFQNGSWPQFPFRFNVMAGIKRQSSHPVTQSLFHVSHKYICYYNKERKTIFNITDINHVIT